MYGDKHAYVFGRIESVENCGESECKCEEAGGCDCLAEGDPSGFGEGATFQYKFSNVSFANWVVCDTGVCVAAANPNDILQVAVAHFQDSSVIAFLEHTEIRHVGLTASKNVLAGTEPIVRNMYLEACGESGAEWIAGPGREVAVLGNLEVCDMFIEVYEDGMVSNVVSARPGISWWGPEDGWRMEPLEGSVAAAYCWTREEFNDALDGLTADLMSEIETPSTQVAGCDTVLSEYNGTSAVSCTGVPSL